MSDQPVFVPGRPNRKLREMVAELEVLRRQGWTAADIHRWLATRGIAVNYTTVRNEIRKLEQRTATAAPSPAAAAAHRPASAMPTPASPVGAAASTDGTGKSFTDTFFDTHRPGNPVLDMLDRQRQNKQQKP